MASNIEKLGETLQGRMHTVRKSKSATLIELGSLVGEKILKPDTSPGPIPQGEYSLCSSGKVKAGDRVLIVWCGDEPVIIDKIVMEGGENNE